MSPVYDCSQIVMVVESLLQENKLSSKGSTKNAKELNSTQPCIALFAEVRRAFASFP